MSRDVRVRVPGSPPHKRVDIMFNVFFACPYCVGNNQDSMGTWLILGAFVLLPFLIVSIVTKVIKKEENRQHGE